MWKRPEVAGNMRKICLLASRFGSWNCVEPTTAVAPLERAGRRAGKLLGSEVELRPRAQHHGVGTMPRPTARGSPGPDCRRGGLEAGTGGLKAPAGRAITWRRRTRIIFLPDHRTKPATASLPDCAANQSRRKPSDCGTTQEQHHEDQVQHKSRPRVPSLRKCPRNPRQLNPRRTAPNQRPGSPEMRRILEPQHGRVKFARSEDCRQPTGCVRLRTPSAAEGRCARS